MKHSTLSDKMQSCIENCTRCHDICLRMSSGYCLELGGEHSKPGHLNLMADCALICETAADFMLRESTRHHEICGICAEICDACAADCARIGDMDECVEACRACAESCLAMAEMNEGES